MGFPPPPFEGLPYRVMAVRAAKEEAAVLGGSWVWGPVAQASSACWDLCFQPPWLIVHLPAGGSCCKGLM